VLTGPGDKKIEAVVAAGEGYSVQAALGEWSIDAKAYNAENALIGTGSAAVTVKAGRNEALIPMRVILQEDEPVAVTGVSLNMATLSLVEGGTGTLTAVITPSNATNQNVTWSSSNPAAATVANGVVSAAAAGTATITVTTEDGGFTANCTVTVTPPPGTQSIHTISGVTVPFRYVPGGSFQRDSDPLNVSVITQGYWMGETEVTQELFEAVMGTGVRPSYFTSNPEDPANPDGWKKLPVEKVAWYAAIAFCNKLSLLDGKDPVYSVSGVSDWATLAYSAIPVGSPNNDWNAADMDATKNGYRLPTEMEWMWAAMGADTTNQPNTTGYAKAFAGDDGNNIVGDCAWNYNNSGSTSHEVGKKNPNELGLKDMSGNLDEFCWDRYGSYPSGEWTDYTGAGAVSGASRVYHGGNHSQAVLFDPVAMRAYVYPYEAHNIMGFRVVCGQ
jgi:formylglycine-generating enzyme required for sulfatase activity